MTAIQILREGQKFKTRHKDGEREKERDIAESDERWREDQMRQAGVESQNQTCNHYKPCMTYEPSYILTCGLVAFHSFRHTSFLCVTEKERLIG